MENGKSEALAAEDWTNAWKDVVELEGGLVLSETIDPPLDFLVGVVVVVVVVRVVVVVVVGTVLTSSPAANASRHWMTSVKTSDLVLR